MARGDLILEERPILQEVLCSEQEEESNFESPALKSYRKKFDALSPEDRKAVLALCDNQSEGGTKNVLNEIIFTNCIRKKEQSKDVANSGVYLLISRMNHSCAPNVGLVRAGPFMRVIAFKEILPGDELCFSYLSYIPWRNRQERLEELKKVKGFTCQCDWCTFKKWKKPILANIKKSNNNRSNIREYDMEIGKIKNLKG